MKMLCTFGCVLKIFNKKGSAKGKYKKAYDSCLHGSTLNHIFKHADGNSRKKTPLEIRANCANKANPPQSEFDRALLSRIPSLAPSESQGKRSKVRKVRLSAGGGDNFATEGEELTASARLFCSSEVATVASLCALQTD
jgi:hypothetical protein